MRAVAGEAAFVEDEVVDPERLGSEGPAVEERANLAAARAAPAGEGDVGVEGAAFGDEADGLADTLDPRVEGAHGLGRFDTGPEYSPAAAVERAEAGEA